MPLPLSSVAIEEKNKLARDSIFVICLKIIIPGLEVPIRIVRDNVEFAWLGESWIPFNFDLDEIGDSSKGESPSVAIRVSNASRAMERYIDDYDIYCKTNGFSPITCHIYVVNTKAVSLDPDCDPEVEHILDLDKPATGPQWCTFTLGAEKLWNRRIPRNRLMKSQCQVRRFKDIACGYTGIETTCDRTLTRCRELENSTRFKGFPGIGIGGLKVA